MKRLAAAVLAALLAALLAAPAGALDIEPEGGEIMPPRRIPAEPVKAKSELPLALRWMLQPMRRGMFVRLPVVDTDPNRGVTYGVMPILVLREERGERIEQIHAPSLTYNKNFGLTPTYRLYYYPTEDSAWIVRGSFAKIEREAMANFDDRTFLNTFADFSTRFQYNVDAGRRFFGVGPNTPRGAETNYKEDYLTYRISAGVPFWWQSRWRAHVSDRVLSEKVANGPLPDLVGLDTRFPGVAPRTHQQTNELRLTLDYDTRDTAVTTTKGGLLQVFAEHATAGFASSFDYGRYGLDARYFQPWSSSKRQVTAAQFKYEQLTGDAPFWLQPQLGGKYSLRAYGEGRYVDRGMMTSTVEQRIAFYRAKMAGVSTDFEVAPFAGVGTVFNEPGRLSRRYLRPVVGGAVRAVARPQVVGSIDVGVGQEGVAIFMDINYSF